MKNRHQNRYNNDINQYIDEAVQITKELVDIAFVGAIAVYLHTKNRSRATSDLDFAAASSLTESYLEEKGYVEFEEHGKPVTRTPPPRRFKFDIYRDDVGEIPVQKIINTAKNISIGKNKGRGIVKIANLEVLIVTKHRANRPQDGEDLQDIAKTKFSEIDWPSLRSFAKTKYEFQEIKTTMNQFHKMGYR
jgi:hypothetical protein